MNKFVTTALALGAAGSVGWADPGGDTEWLELDSEINRLATSLTPAQDGMGWTALLRVTFAYAGDDLLSGLGFEDQDISGFVIHDADVALWGSVGDYGWRVSTDLDGNTQSNGDSFGSDEEFLAETYLAVYTGSNEFGQFLLEDAYGYWDCGDYFLAKMGQFKPRVFRSGFVDPEHQIMINRTFIGTAFDFWNLGLGGSGTYPQGEHQFGWELAVLNGDNGAFADHLYTARLSYNFGRGAGMYEGAMGGDDDFNATLGLMYVTDDSRGDADQDVWGLDIAGSAGMLGFLGEIADVDDGGFLAPGPFPGGLGGDSTPWSVTLTWLLASDWEIAGRYEDTDTGGDDELLHLGLNWYKGGNHNAKWQAQVTDVDALDEVLVQVGLVVGATR